MSLLVVAAILQIGGCVFFESPLSATPIGLCDTRINGMWKPTNAAQLRVEIIEVNVSSDCSVSKFLVTNQEENEKRNSYDMQVVFSTLPSGAYISGYSGPDRNSDEKARYFIAKYSFASDNTLIVVFPDIVFVNKAIKSGEIDGEITQGFVGKTSVYGSIMQTRKLFHTHGSSMFDSKLTIELTRVGS